MTMRRYLPFIFLTLALHWTPVLAQERSDQSALAQEESADYFRKWLDEDVIHIITEEEREVFESLTTGDEKEQFIEQFWFRRDPSPMTSENEFKAEHYRRIAFANERFSAGLPGWKSDRGRIYIIHGEPAEIESHPAGGHYERPLSEGGGSTTTFPFEVWRYRFIEGMGNDIVLEFVDPSLSGEYRLALRPEEKDAMLYVPGGGATLAEGMGLATKADRPYFSPGNRDHYPMMVETARDNPFNRYETYAQVQRPLELKYQDLKEMVSVNVGYASLPIQVREDYFRLNDRQVLVPVTFQVPNKNLSFKTDGNFQTARVAVYGIVTSMSNRVVNEFEDDLVVSYRSEQFEQGLLKQSVYQRIIPVDARMRYKLDLIVKDLNSQQVGVQRRAIAPPKFEGDTLQTSSVILSQYLLALDAVPERDEMFVIGDVKVVPNLESKFAPELPLGFYLQVYNFGIDQTTLNPSLDISYRVISEGKILRQTNDTSGESIQYFSGRRVVFVKSIAIDELEPGTYQAEVEVHDRLTDQRVRVDRSFQIVGVD
ncbi:MAG: GWxTD domain-containing protein [Acidobacteriota bacterium]|nr:MAG: GWxTD domain-containing protein [Acidobacteriota bacterium]